MSELTYIQCHFVKGVINHRLRFGRPVETLKLDKYRSLAFFKPNQTLGYIRWRANEYGTQDWRFYILKTGECGCQTKVPGVSPAANTLATFVGRDPVRKALSAFDDVEFEAIGRVEDVPESYWRTFSSSVMTRQSPRSLPRHYRIAEASRAR